MGRIKRELLLLAEAEVSATVASVVDFGLALGLFYGGVMDYTWANIIGVVSGGVTNCVLNRRYVFRQCTRSKKSVAWRYFLVWAVSFCLNGLGTNALTARVGEKWFVYVKSVVAFMVAIFVNYPAQRKFVFR